MNIIHLIAGPRNISTSLMYSFNNRNDCIGVDEPFYAHYLSQTGLQHPDYETIIEEMETEEDVIVNKLLSYESQTEFLFVKNMASHLNLLSDNFYFRLKNVFLIRDTDSVINSYTKVISNITIDDIGIKQEFEIYNALVAQGQAPPIIDSAELLKNPEKVLTAVCAQLGIPFDKKMLSWEVGPKDIDGIWANHWYGNTHKSTGFSNNVLSEKRPVQDSLIELSREAKKYYQPLYDKSIKA